MLQKYLDFHEQLKLYSLLDEMRTSLLIIDKILKNRFCLILTAFGLTALVVCPLIDKYPQFRKVDDAQSYISMAEGHPQDVLLHHSRRILFPWIVGHLRWLGGTHIAFLATAIFCLWTFFFVNLNLLRDYKKMPLIYCIALIFLPYLYDLFINLYLPTLFFLALSSIFWFVLIKKHYGLSLFILLLLVLTRDEAMIITMSLVIIFLLKKQKEIRRRYFSGFILGVLIVSILGLLLTTYATRSNTNLHKMSGPFFSVLRMPLFLIRNLTGFEHWVDTYRTLEPYTHEPLIRWDVPSCIRRISRIRQFGIYQWNPRNIINTFWLILSVFGTGPTIILFFLKRKKIKEIVESSLSYMVIFTYSCLIMILSPSLGPPGIRYYINAWPLFFLLLPILIKQIIGIHKLDHACPIIS